MRRLRPSLHANGQPETTPSEMRRLVGEAAGGSRVATSAEVLLQSVWQRLQKAGYPEEASEACLRRQRERVNSLRQASHLIKKK